MNAMKPVLTVSLGVHTDSLSRRLDEEGIIYRWQQAASEQLLLVDSESNSERIAELIHDWRLEQSSSRGMVDVQSIKTWLVRSTRLFPLTVLLMVINLVCLPAGLSLADSGEVTELLRALSPYAIVLSPQGYLLQPLAEGLANGGWWRLVTPMLLHFSWLHITFNLLWVWEVGRRIEYVHGWRWLVIVTVIASVAANALQAILAPMQLFGGMSGVVFAYLGYVMIWDWLRPNSRIGLAKGV
ncbi:MAG: rhomboid family intramembrane serine protease, partial [Pseudomonadales bacterium]